MPRWLGYALIATALWGAWAAAAKGADRAGVAAHLVQGLLPVGLVPVAAALLLAPSAVPGPKPGRGAAYALATGAAAGLGNWAFFEALARGPASAAGPVAYLFPLVTLLLAVGLLGERVGRVQAAGVALAVAAVVVFGLSDAPAAGGDAGARWLAPALVALALWGVSGVTQKLATAWTSAERATAWVAAAFVLLGAAMLAWRPPDWDALTPAGWAWLVAVGAVNGLALAAAFAALRAGGKAAVVTPLMTLAPVVTVGLAVGLFGERPAAREWVGIVLAVLAAVALAREPRPEPGATEEPA